MPTLHKIGGTGNWTDTSKWSLTSGGGSAGVYPGSGDAVIIDSNSGGGALTINAAATCASWTQTATMNLTLAADLDVVGVMEKTGAGDFVITFAGYTITAENFRRSAGGSFSFGGEIVITGADNGGDCLSLGNNPLGGGTYRFTYSGSGTRTATINPLAGNSDVFVEAGTGAFALSTSDDVRHVDFTGFSGQLTGTGTVQFTGDLTLSATMTIATSTGDIDAVGAVSTTQTITTNGVTLNRDLDIDGDATVDLADAIVMGTGKFFSTTTGFEGVLNTNGFDVTGVGGLAGSAGTVNLGASTLTFTSSFASLDAGTINAGTSLLRFTPASSLTISQMDNRTLNAVEVAGSGNVSFSTTDGATIADLTILPGADDMPRAITFPAGSTTYLGALDCTGASGEEITLQSDTPGSPFTLSKASGTVECDWLEIIDSTATGGATWIAGDNSVDGGGNSGWSFPLPPGLGRFFALFG